MSIFWNKLRTVCLLVLLCAGLARPLLAAVPSAGVDDDQAFKDAIYVSATDTDPIKLAHYPKVITAVVDGRYTMVEVSLDGHSNRENVNIEGFRVYQGDKILTKFLMKSEFHPYHCIFYLNPQKFPKGTTLTLVTFCAVDGSFKRDFVVE